MLTHFQEHELIEQLRKVGLRATNQRLAIIRALIDHPDHPSAEDIYRHLKRSHPTLSLATVYKTLQVMGDMGALLTIETGASSLRFDGRTHPHHHAVCDQCGKVYDVDFNKHPVDLNTKGILQGFKVKSVKVIFAGICHLCQTTANQFQTPAASG